MKTDKCILKHRMKGIDLESWQSLTNMLAKLYNASSGAVVQLREGEFNVVSTSENTHNFLHKDVSWPWEMNSFCRRMVETGQSLYVGDAQNNTEWADSPSVCKGPVRSYFGYPLYWPNGDLFGSICIIDTKPTSYTVEFLSLLNELKKLVEAHLKHAFDFEQISYHALHDQLTECANRLLMRERIDSQIVRAKRQKERFSIIYLDLNEFKPINDTYGHQAGDFILQTVVSRLNSAIRETDLLARTGGDEFVIIFEGEVEPDNMIQKLSDAIAGSIDWEGKTLQISASFGHACYPDNGNSMSALLNAADQMMYQNKKN